MAGNFHRLVRQLRARETPQAVLRDARGRLELIPQDSVRLARMMSSAHWSRRVVGVFTPDVPLPDLLREVGA